MGEDKKLAEKLTRVYLKIRERKAQLSIDFKQQEKELTRQLDKVKAALLGDWEAMHQFVMEHDVPEFLEKRLNQTTVRTFLEENPDAIPKGLNVDSEYVISVRKK